MLVHTIMKAGMRKCTNSCKNKDGQNQWKDKRQNYSAEAGQWDQLCQGEMKKKLCEVQQMFFKKKTIFLKSFLKRLEQERAPKGVNFFLSSDCWSVAPLLKTKLGTGTRCFSNSRKVYTSSFSLKSCLKRLQTRCAFALDQPMTSHWAPSRNVWMWTTCALEVFLQTRNTCACHCAVLRHTGDKASSEHYSSKSSFVYFSQNCFK